MISMKTDAGESGFDAVQLQRYTASSVLARAMACLVLALSLAAQGTGNQAAIDAATADIRADIDALKAIVTRDTPAP